MVGEGRQFVVAGMERARTTAGGDPGPPLASTPTDVAVEQL